MAANTAIGWTKHTLNYWWGCTEVSPACDFCYARTWAQRLGWNIWGALKERRKIESAVATLAQYNRNDPGALVFIQSMADLFDKEVPLDWFREAWVSIEAADRLRLQILTKRISLVERRLAAIERTTGLGWQWPQHAGLMITVVNQVEADRDIPRLLDLKQRWGIPWVGVSMEPLLEAVDITGYLYICTHEDDRLLLEPPDGERDPNAPPPVVDFHDPADTPPEEISCPRLDWVIVGGESGKDARPMHPDWARGLRDQCAAAGVPYFFKQWGEWVPQVGAVDGWTIDDDPEISRFDHRDWEGDHWGKDYRPMWCDERDDDTVSRVGTKRAGNLLDGRRHEAFPAPLSTEPQGEGVTGAAHGH